MGRIAKDLLSHFQDSFFTAATRPSQFPAGSSSANKEYPSGVEPRMEARCFPAGLILGGNKWNNTRRSYPNLERSTTSTRRRLKPVPLRVQALCGFSVDPDLVVVGRSECEFCKKEARIIKEREK